MTEILYSFLLYVTLLLISPEGDTIIYWLFQLLFNWPSVKIWWPEDLFCDQASQHIGSLFLLCGFIPHHKLLWGAEVPFCPMSVWRSINSAFEMTVREVSLCCCASIPHKGYSVQVQNSISYHLTGCSWALFPTQQGSNAVPALYFVCIRSVLSVPAWPSAPARDGWLSALGSQGRAC